MHTLPTLPTTGGGGMAPLTWTEMVVSWFFYTTLLAVALTIAGMIIITLFGLNRRTDARAIDNLEARVMQLEAKNAASNTPETP